MNTQTIPMIKTLDINEVENVLKEGDVIIDVRTPAEYAEGYIPNCLHIDIYNPEFQSRINELDKDKTYYLYCRSGNRSGAAANFMLQLGFREVYNLTGGIMAYRGELSR